MCPAGHEAVSECEEGGVLTALLGRGHGGPESPLHGSHPTLSGIHQNEVC